MSEKDAAIALAHRVLDRVNADPDDDLAILARQLLRHNERIGILCSALIAVGKQLSAIRALCQGSLMMSEKKVDRLSDYVVAGWQEIERGFVAFGETVPLENRHDIRP